ncbi:MAG: hypothetical protein WBK91_02280 [Alphaproteobacteria bacterium]
MTRTLSKLRFCALAVFGLVMLSGAQALAQTVDNGCTDINGVRLGDCSRLDKGDGRVTIKATDCGNPDSTVPDCSAVPGASIYSPPAEANALCRTIHNTGSLDYFVPWKTAEEWGKFLAWARSPDGVTQGLSIHKCCLPQVGTVCANQIYNGIHVGAAGLPAFDPVTGNPIQLGKRLLGMRSGGAGDHGAHNDVSDVLDAAALLGDATINYKVTYVCDGGSWVKTFEEGSCTPLDGACGASVPATGVSPLTMTALEQEKLLCIPGSVMSNLVNHGTYWSWSCLGTPLRATATCTAANTDTNSGVARCGAANFGRLPGMPTTAVELCSGGTPSVIGGTGSAASPWSWTCTDSSGNTDGCLAYRQGTQLDGVCGPGHGLESSDFSWIPGTYPGEELCANGTQLTAAGLITSPSSFNWSCAGENGGADTACAASRTFEGDCGSEDYTAGTTPPTIAGLCDVGTPSAVTYGNAMEGGGLKAWLWTCAGALPCNGSMLCSCEKIDINGPQPGVCGMDGLSLGNIYTASEVPSNELCEYGSTLVAPPVWVPAAAHWEWQCQGINGGTTINCATTAVPQDGTCTYNATNFVVTPTDPLPANACGWGMTPINQTIAGTAYTYQCPGPAGGATADCAVGYDPLGIHGVCGYKQGQLLSGGVVPEVSTLCSSGTPAGQSFHSRQPNRYQWTCLGSNSIFNKTCYIYVNPQPGICGTAHNTQQSSEPTTPASRCYYGSRSEVTASAFGWSWTCQGMAGTPPTACHATSSSGSGSGNDGVCGVANGSQVTLAPTANLCSIGTPTTVIGTGPWTWSCVSGSGGATAACIATRPTATGPGACGTTDGTTIPARPNANLCSTGVPSAVAGSGPWTWDCVGTSTASCSADICSACTGTVAGVPRSETIPAQSINFGGGTCAVSGTVTWNGTDIISSDNAAQDLTLANNASGLSFSKSLVPAAAPNTFCPPCYRRAQTINGSFMVQKNGVCTGSSLDDGAPATIVINNVHIQ